MQHIEASSVRFSPPIEAQEKLPLSTETLAIFSATVPSNDQNNGKALPSSKKHRFGPHFEIRIPQTSERR